jgi:tape measure domain-containing protein
MSSIDERVVQMKFDNGQFAKGVADTRGALDQLKQGLNLDASTKSLEGLDAAGKRFSLASIAEGVSSLSSKFTALGIIGVTALANIANKAINAGMAFADSFTMAPIRDGFNEYEQKMGSIQTILANTARHGTGLDQVKASLEELNAYSDKTIYNFGDMTRNIGMFTNAGIKLEDATAMIKGFSNEAAMSGTNAQQAAGAAYQLSQAMSKGKVTLEDWRSLTNASMGNKNMQLGLVDIANAMGTFKKAGISAKTAQEDFNGSLEKGWLSADVMTTYLKIQAGEMDTAKMKSIGLTDAQIENFQKMQKIAEESATKVRTWTQLIGTIKESIGSTWATTFELLLGDFNEATDLFTKINDTLGPMIGAAGDARNKLIKGWVDAGGRAMMINAFSTAFTSLVAIMHVVQRAWAQVFPPVTVDTVMTLTEKFKAFIDSLRPSQETLMKLQTVFRAVFSILDIGWLTVQRLWGVFERLFKGMDGAGGGVLDFLVKVSQLILKFHDWYSSSEKINAFLVGLTPLLKAPGTALNWLINQINALWDRIAKFDFSKFKVDMSGFINGWNSLRVGIEKLKPTGDTVGNIWKTLGQIFEKVIELGGKMAEKLGHAFANLGKAVEAAASGVNFQNILGILGVGALASIFMTIKKFFGGLTDVLKKFAGDGEESGGGLMDKIKETLGGVTDTLSNMQQTLKASTLILIAGAIALLTYSVVQLSKVDATKLPPVLAAITAMFIQLSLAMAVLDKLNIGAGVLKMAALGTGMILFAIAINILTKAVKALSELDWQKMMQGLIGTTGLIVALAGAFRLMPANPSGMIGLGIALIGFAIAIKILASAVDDISKLDWQKMMQGLIGVGMMLGGLAIFTQVAKVNKGAIGSAAGLILLGIALKILASAVEDFSKMDWQKMMQGLIAMGMLLGGLAAFSRLVNPGQMIAMGISVAIIAGSMKLFAIALNDFAAMDWQKMMQGLITMGLILAGVAAFSRLVNPVQMVGMGISMIAIAFAMDMMAGVLKKLGGMSWEELQKGLLALGAALVVMALGVNMMVGALAGAAALLVVVAALTLFVPVLQQLGAMSWEQIWTGIGALALSLLTLGVAGVVLGILSPLFMLFGASLILVGAGALMAGAGLLMFSLGITALAVAGAAGVTVLVASVTALLGLIPFGMTQIGLGIAAMAKVLADNVPAFVDAGVKMLLGLIDGLRQVLPAIVSFIFDMILMILQAIADNLPKIIQAGFDILIGFLQGIANNIGRVVTTATDVIVNFLNGIANNIGRIIDAGVNLVVKFIEGIANNLNKITNAGADLVIAAVNAVADTINNKRAEMQAAGEKLAWAIADGLTGGMASKARNIAAEAWELGKKAIAAIKGAIDSNSPSKESRKLGNYLGDGFALGISDLGYLSQRSAGEVGSNALEAMKASIRNAGADLDGGMLMHPTIQPVLDLTNVQKESQRLGSMLALPPLDIMGTYQTAAAVVASQREQARIEAEFQNQHDGGDAPDAGGITYIQNNYSPKALPRADIYRGTKSQLSDLKAQKGVLTGSVVQS